MATSIYTANSTTLTDVTRGRFIWPSPADGSVAISASQFGYMLDGIHWSNPQLTWRPKSAG